MKIGQYKGYEIHTSETPNGSYGKSVRGTSKTISIQVRDYKVMGGGGYLLKKQISFLKGDNDKKNKAIEKAKLWCDENCYY